MELQPSLQWHFGTRIAFRFCFIYFVLYAFPFPLGWLPFTDFVWEGYNTFWLRPIAWTGKHLLAISYDITVLPNGSGDTTYNYVQVFLFALVAIIGTLIWSLFDRKNMHHDRLWHWLIIYLRYYLGIVLLGYGFAKVIKTQFPFSSIEHLSQTYGESTPMGLLWTFMGYSKAYNIFTGLAEVGAGVLLFFKRTKMIGAMIAIAVMSNVVLLNFTYDVPVKLLSSHLLVIAIVLLVPDLRRLADFFVMNRTTPAANLQPVYKNETSKKIYFAAKGVFIVGILATHVMQGLDLQEKWKEFFREPTVYGVFDVETFVMKGDTLPPLINDTRRWKRIIIHKIDEHKIQHANIQYMDGAAIPWKLSADSLKHEVTVYSADSTTAYHFTYSVEENKIMLNSVANDNTYIRLLVRSDDAFALLNHGFRWINEYPDNR